MEWTRLLARGGMRAASQHGSVDRIALLSTPRSGNFWLRGLLAASFGLEQIAVHRPWELLDRELPARCIVQVHWPCEPELRAFLGEHHFRPAVILRHPLDVLISILQFAPHEPQTACWMDGEGGDESAILGVSPCSREFLDYATGPRAAALLSLSRQWWRRRGCVGFRFEDLVERTEAELVRGCGRLGEVPTGAIPDAIEANTLSRLRGSSHNHHFWQGKPGLWRSLIPPRAAREIAEAHRELFAPLGYRCDPDESLDVPRAEANWARLTSSLEPGMPPAN